MLTIVLVLGLCACEQSTDATWQEQYDLGVRYLSEGNYEEAIIAFTAAIDIDAKGAFAYLGRAQTQVLYANEMFPEAEDVYNWPKEKLELYDLAESDYRNAIELERTLVDAYTGLSDLYMAQKLWNEAQEIIAAGLLHNKDNSVLQQKAEEILGMKKEHTERVLRQIDYGILLTGYQLQGALNRSVIADADQDGQDELFISCRSNRYTDVILAFDEKGGNPYCLSTGFYAATGSRELLYSNHAKSPVIFDWFSSMASGDSEAYSFWDGSNWDCQITYHADLDFEAMLGGADLAYKTPEINFRGEAISPEAYRANIQEMDLQPPAGRTENEERYWVGQVEMEYISDLLTQHLSAFYPGEHPSVSFDIDDDGEQEKLWAVTGLTDYWYANDPQHQQTNDEMGVPEISGTALIIADEVSGMISLSCGVAQGVEVVSLQEKEGLLLIDDLGGTHQFREISTDTRELILDAVEDPAWDLLFHSDWYLLDFSGYYAYRYRFEDATNATVDMFDLETGELSPEESGKPLEFVLDRINKKITIAVGGAKIVYQYLPEHEYGAILLQSMEESEFAGDVQRVMWSFPKNMDPTEIRELLYEKERLMWGW